MESGITLSEIILCVILLSVVMLNVIMLKDITLSVVILSVIWLNVEAPIDKYICEYEACKVSIFCYPTCSGKIS